MRSVVARGSTETGSCPHHFERGGAPRSILVSGAGCRATALPEAAEAADRSSWLLLGGPFPRDRVGLILNDVAKSIGQLSGLCNRLNKSIAGSHAGRLQPRALRCRVGLPARPAPMTDFEGRHFESEAVLWTARRYWQRPVSWRSWRVDEASSKRRGAGGTSTARPRSGARPSISTYRRPATPMPPGDAIATAALKAEGRLAEETSHHQVALWQYGGGIRGEALPIERLLGLCTA